ncbi:MAG: HIT family protein [Actinomycetota bacterium]
MCKFCAIARGESAAHIVFEDEASLAFLDHRPLFHGHLLLITRDHHTTLTDLPEELVGPLFTTARLLATVVEEAMAAEGSFVALNNRVSQSVPHLHVHIVPRRRKDGLRGFFWPRHRYDDDAQMATVAAKIRAVAEAWATK